MVLGREKEMKRKIFGGGNIFGCRRKKKGEGKKGKCLEKENIWKGKYFVQGGEEEMRRKKRKIFREGKYLVLGR